VIDNVKFIFTTLWTNLSNTKRLIIQQNLSDFSVIKNHGKKMLPDDYNRLHQTCLRFLKDKLPKNEKAKLPLYISQAYNLYQTSLFGQELILVQPVNAQGLSVAQTEKQLKNLYKLLHKKVVLVPDKIASYNRARLINKKVNFIVPGKQLFLPEMLMDLREGYLTNLMTPEKQNLIPSAQVVVLFIKPKTKNFPLQIELFSKIPDVMDLDGQPHLTPIPVEDDLSSLSAILMDEDYYNFTIEYSKNEEGAHIANSEALICLKAKAYSDLARRKADGEKVDEKNIRKHKTDIFRLTALLAPEQRFRLPQGMKNNMQLFVDS